MDIAKALTLFLVQLAADGRAHNYLAQVRRHIRVLARWADGVGHSGKIEDLTHVDLAAVLVSPEARMRPDGKPKCASSVNALRTSLRVFFRYLHEAGVLDSNPARLVRHARTGTPPPRALSKREENRLLDTLAGAQGAEEQRDAMLIELMLRTGIRLSSALALDVEDVDLEEGVILISAKNDRRERVFVSRSTRNELEAFLGDRTSGPVFVTQSGRRICGRHAQRRFAMWRDRAGLPASVSPHALRHTFATTLYRKTGDILLVKEALGHAAIESTLVYARVPNRRLREALTSST